MARIVKKPEAGEVKASPTAAPKQRSRTAKTAPAKPQPKESTATVPKPRQRAAKAAPAKAEPVVVSDLRELAEAVLENKITPSLDQAKALAKFVFKHKKSGKSKKAKTAKPKENKKGKDKAGKKGKSSGKKADIKEPKVRLPKLRGS